MVVSEALELGVLNRNLVEDLKSTLIGLRWFIFEAWLQLNKNDLLVARQTGQPGHFTSAMKAHE